MKREGWVGKCQEGKDKKPRFEVSRLSIVWGPSLVPFSAFHRLLGWDGCTNIEDGTFPLLNEGFKPVDDHHC